MGGCLSLSRKPDLSGPTFSHYSLTSQEDHLDLYPGFRYAETESSTLEDSQSAWRRSSVPLLESWETSSQASQPGAYYCDNTSEVNRAPLEGNTPGSQLWDRTIGKLRNSLRRNKVRAAASTQAEQSESVRQRERQRLSTDTTSEDLV